MAFFGESSGFEDSFSESDFGDAGSMSLGSGLPSYPSSEFSSKRDVMQNMEPEVFRNIPSFEQLSVPTPCSSLSGKNFGFQDSFSATSSKSPFQEFPDSPKLVGAPKARLGNYSESASDIGAVPLLKDIPDWVDPHLSFTVQTNQFDVLETIEQCLLSQQVDSNTDRAKFKITAVLFDSHLPSRFQIRLYKPTYPQTGTTVEFCKRSECGLGFRNLFCTVAKALGVSKPAANSLAALPLPMEESDDVQGLIQKLVALVRSGLADQQKQAAAALVEVSCRHHQLLFQQDEILALLLELLRSHDEDVVRCAAVVFANVAVHCNTDDTEKLLGPMFQALVTPSTLVNKSTKRYISAALVDLAQKFCAARPFPGQFVGTLGLLKSSCPDRVLVNNIINTEAALSSNRAFSFVR